MGYRKTNLTRFLFRTIFQKNPSPLSKGPCEMFPIRGEDFFQPWGRKKPTYQLKIYGWKMKCPFGMAHFQVPYQFLGGHIDWVATPWSTESTCKPLLTMLCLRHNNNLRVERVQGKMPWIDLLASPNGPPKNLQSFVFYLYPPEVEQQKPLENWACQ